MHLLNLSLFLFSAITFMAYAFRYYLLSFAIIKVKDDVRAENKREPLITIIVPAFREFAVIQRILKAIIRLNYPKIQPIIINDGHFQDRGKSALIIDEFREKHPSVMAIHRFNGGRGKSYALNEVLPYAQGEFILFLDADYVPDPDLIQHLLAFFAVDDKCAAVQGFIEPNNKGFIPNVCKLERITCYCVELFAREKLGLVPQIGGTVMMLKADIIKKFKFSTQILAEDTDLTFRLLINDLNIHYTMVAKSFEDAPSSIKSYWRQRHRWAYGHMQCAFKHTVPLLRSGLDLKKKIDGLFVLGLYFLPLISLLNLVMIIFMPFNLVWWVYVIFGSAAPFFSIIMGAIKFKNARALKYLPALIIFFPLNALISWHALIQLFWNTLRRKKLAWAHTPHG